MDVKNHLRSRQIKVQIASGRRGPNLGGAAIKRREGRMDRDEGMIEVTK